MKEGFSKYLEPDDVVVMSIYRSYGIMYLACAIIAAVYRGTLFINSLSKSCSLAKFT